MFFTLLDFSSPCVPVRWHHFLLSVEELAVVSVFVEVSSVFPGGCNVAALGPPPFWSVSCLYCCRARLTASSTNRLLTLRSSASSGSEMRRPPEEKQIKDAIKVLQWKLGTQTLPQIKIILNELLLFPTTIRDVVSCYKNQNQQHEHWQSPTNQSNRQP